MSIAAMAMALAMMVQSPAETAASPPPDALSVARAYLDRMYALEFDSLPELLAEDAVFEDPTAGVAGSTAVRGNDNIAAAFQATAGPLESVEYAIENSFVFNDLVVLSLTYNARIRGADLGQDAEYICSVAPAVTILAVGDGLIQSHTDYVDYGAFTAGFRPC